MESNSIQTHMIQQSMMIQYINNLAPASTNEAFITPVLATKVINYVHLLNNRMGVTDEVMN
jgi:hypothetical protein